MVQRYDILPELRCMHRYEDGDYVLFKDYAALQAENERLKAANVETLAAMRHAVVALAYAQQNDPIYLQPYGLLDEAIRRAKDVNP